MPAKLWSGKYFPDTRAHFVVQLANSALEILADEFTYNTFPFRVTILPVSLDPSVSQPGPNLLKSNSSIVFDYNLCQLHLSAAHHSFSIFTVSHLPKVPAKAARTVRSKDLLTETDVPIGRCSLLEIWKNSFLIIAKEEMLSGTWDTIVKKLNNILKEQEISGFLSRWIERPSWSRNNQETFEYFKEIDDCRSVG